MNTINKFSGILLMFFLTLVVVSCEEDKVVRDPSPLSDPKSNKVFFPEQDSAISNRTVLLAINDASFTVKLQRAKFSESLTIKLKLIDDTDSSGVFSLPESVTFNAGDSITSFNVTVGNIEYLTQYTVSIQIDDNVNVDPYFVKYPVTTWKVTKEDFAPYAEGIYTSSWTEEVMDRILEYSPATQRYRIKSFCGVDGYSILFTWDVDNNIKFIGGTYKPGATEYKPAFYTGQIDSDYGDVWAIFGGENTYDPETKTFTFPVTWRVSLGSFGTFPDTYTITNVF